MSVKKFVLVLAVVACSASSVFGAPLITSVAEFGTVITAPIPTNPPVPKALDTQGPVVSSFSSPGPTSPTTFLPTSFGMFDLSNGQEEPFQFSDRSHEFTNPRTNASGVLATANSGTLRAIPWYLRGTDQNADTLLDGLEYIQTANDNRDIIDYRLDVTLSAPVTAFLMLDNRNNGATSPPSLVGASNIDDPVLAGPLQWVIDDGWTRVRSGQMPNGQSDMLGSDEGGTVATADLRLHTLGGNVAGPGEGLNQFYSIYRKDFTTAGLKAGFTKANGIPGGSTYTVAVRPLMAHPILAGDVNFDGAVNSADYTLIRTNFNQTGKTYAEGDISGDGTVDFSDFRIWKNNKTVPGSTAGFEAELSALVPEPGSLMLLVMGAISLGVASGRRR